MYGEGWTIAAFDAFYMKLCVSVWRPSRLQQLCLLRMIHNYSHQLNFWSIFSLVFIFNTFYAEKVEARLRGMKIWWLMRIASGYDSNFQNSDKSVTHINVGPMIGTGFKKYYLKTHLISFINNHYNSSHKLVKCIKLEQ